MRTHVTAFSGPRLSQARLARGWSRGRLAVQLDVALETVAGWERGENTPVPPSIAALADALGVDAARLFDGEPDTWTLAELRVISGLRQTDAAGELKILPGRLGRLEASYERLDPAVAAGMAEVYGVDEPTVHACWQRARDRLLADG